MVKPKKAKQKISRNEIFEKTLGMPISPLIIHGRASIVYVLSFIFLSFFSSLAV
jgi:hypothetical protein